MCCCCTYAHCKMMLSMIYSAVNHGRKVQACPGSGLPSRTTSLLSKGVGVTPLMVTPGTKNLVTDNMNPISATTVGRCRRSCTCTNRTGWTRGRCSLCMLTESEALVCPSPWVCHGTRTTQHWSSSMHGKQNKNQDLRALGASANMQWTLQQDRPSVWPTGVVQKTPGSRMRAS